MNRLTPDAGAVRNCSNGPLPQWLESRATFSRDKHEFALKREDAIEYLDWCQKQGLRVLGFDLWTAADPRPAVLGGVDEGFEGNAQECRAAITSPEFPGEPLFNIWVDIDDAAGSA